MKRGPRWHFRVAPPEPEAAAAAAWRGRLFCCRGQDPPAPGPEAAAHTSRLDPGDARPDPDYRGAAPGRPCCSLPPPPPLPSPFPAGDMARV